MTNENVAPKDLADNFVTIPVVEIEAKALPPVEVNDEGEISYLQTEEEIGGEPGNHTDNVTVNVTVH